VNGIRATGDLSAKFGVSRDRTLGEKPPYRRNG
jgi:hypothetical protein